MDPLSEVLDSLRLRNTLYSKVELSPPWGVAFAPSSLSVFHVITEGEGWLVFDDASIHPPVHLQSGDMIMLARGIAHEIKDNLNTAIFTQMQITPEGDILQEINLFRKEGQGGYVGLICGGFYFERAETHPLLSLLPQFIHIKGNAGQSPDWLHTTLNHLANEAALRQPGTSTMLKRLIDILFIQVVRVWLENKPKEDGGWLNGLKDPGIGKALGLIHREAERSWTVTELGIEVGMSRSVFSQRFTELVGESPGQYLIKWRMHLAASLLERDHNITVTEVAARVSYASETTFSKVFKRQFGITPGSYRRTNNLS